MGIVSFLLFGFVIGLLARALLPGRQGLGIVMTTLLGVIGSFVGGLLGSLISGNSIDQVHPAGFIGSLVGALLALGAFVSLSRRRGV